MLNTNVFEVTLGRFESNVPQLWEIDRRRSMHVSVVRWKLIRLLSTDRRSQNTRFEIALLSSPKYSDVKGSESWHRW